MSDELTGSHRRVIDARAAAQKHRIELDGIRANLLPKGGHAWRRIGIGYATAILVVVWMVGIMFQSQKGSQSISSPNATSSGQQFVRQGAPPSAVNPADFPADWPKPQRGGVFIFPPEYLDPDPTLPGTPRPPVYVPGPGEPPPDRHTETPVKPPALKRLGYHQANCMLSGRPRTDEDRRDFSDRNGFGFCKEIGIRANAYRTSMKLLRQEIKPNPRDKQLAGEYMAAVNQMANQYPLRAVHVFAFLAWGDDESWNKAWENLATLSRRE